MTTKKPLYPRPHGGSGPDQYAKFDIPFPSAKQSVSDLQLDGYRFEAGTDTDSLDDGDSRIMVKTTTINIASMT